ncbi:MAG: hypothetical protein V1873_04775 [Verrucomicrobiota bacterium]
MWPFLLLILSAVPVFAESPPLAIELAGEGDHPAAALEFRRLGLGASGAARGGYYWASAYEYWKAGKYDLADKMLNRAEDAAPMLGTRAVLLRGERALSARDYREAAFYWETVLHSPADADARSLAARRLAVTRLRENDAARAREALLAAPTKHDDGLAALDRYTAGRDKNPKLGGWLGAVPGLGYFYAGEWANGLRSIILNGLFLYGMADTADREQWGAFAVITFFEFTWYSGSIYGGIDASHRYNRRRLEDAVAGVDGGAKFEPDFSQLPVVTLQFRF